MPTDFSLYFLVPICTIAAILVVLFLLPPILLTHFQRKRERLERSHGFEVKNSAGALPVQLKEKEYDHG